MALEIGKFIAEALHRLVDAGLLVPLAGRGLLAHAFVKRDDSRPAAAQVWPG
ncbi:hypothetical protein J2W27_004654 [Variovorax boronicumulans]|uniref:hypothetical protein n=1 Tax=Variovorax boronicumulans TaxID=436515 RepID=UPI002789DE86|nr:hypothetical protein [Variovorax boronicumulans]MDP9912528.1 hypothetical protein [Variovorax boronicumulans]